LQAAAEAPRRLREDLHEVIRGLSPLVERSQNINLSTWLRHSRSHLQGTSSVASPLISSPNQNAGSLAHTGSSEFVISVDDGVSIENGDEHEMAPVVSNNNDLPNAAAASNATASQQNDAIRQSPELRKVLSEAEKYLPFLLILLAKLIFDHKTGILVLAGLVITFMHANSVIRREVGKQSKRNLASLAAISINLLTCIVFIYYVFESEKLHYSLIFMLPTRNHALTFWELLWIVGVTDFVLKLITILCKAIVIVLPAQIIQFQKKGKYYLFIEQTSQLYRSFIPIQPWIFYLLEAYEGLNRIFGLILSIAYIISKGKDVLKKIKSWKCSLSKLMQSVTYGSRPTKEQLDLTGNMCPICQDDFRHPTMLECKHTFCEECVVRWFDRERTCPMCRALIADDPTWRDGSTTFFLQLF